MALRVGRKRHGSVLRLIHLALLAASIAACASAAPTADPVPTSVVDPTGILLVDVEEQVQAGPVTEDFADALGLALELVESNGEDIGYPWIDPVTGELILSAATPRGRELIEGAGLTVPYRIREVAHGATELRRIQDDATFLASRGVEGAELIFMTLPDHRDNRALIVISEMSRPLLDYLAAHYPVDALAVQIDPEVPDAGPG